MNLLTSLKLFRVWIVSVLISCTNNKLPNVEGSGTGGDEYGSVEIFCFLSNQDQTHSLCTTTIAVTAADLTRQKEKLLRIINNRDTVNKLKSIIFTEKKVVEPKVFHSEARFVFVFKADEYKSDTVSVYADSILHYNNKAFFKYPFKIMDSGRLILAKKEIECSH